MTVAAEELVERRSPSGFTKLAWLTDIHLDLVDVDQIDDLFDAVKQSGANVVAIGGDVGRSETFQGHLVKLVERSERPLYFVLGNHDYYGSSLADTKRMARELSRDNPKIHYLPDEGVVHLTDETVLIGHGLFGDGRAGNASRSKLELADHHLIEDFTGLSREVLFKKLNNLGDVLAAWTREHLVSALEGSRRVLFLTHAPPFEGPSRILERASSSDVLPFYICSAVGDVLLEIMEEYPENHLTVLSGHRHMASEFDVAQNIHVITGGAKYMEPQLQSLFEIE